jgi:L-seryl-tRNA(Ser) seleniumtransferase
VVLLENIHPRAVELLEAAGYTVEAHKKAYSGAELIEVGTTNRTRAADYRAVSDQAALLLKVHRSNFTIVGFTEETGVAELAAMGPPVVVDLGSGLLDAGCPWLGSGPPAWLEHEPAVRQTLREGADLVTFSGDKLLGGPQAGIIAGDEQLLRRCAAHPLYRVVRPGALLLHALQDVALAYLDGSARSLPFWSMATRTTAELRERAERIGVGEVVTCSSLPGGGTLPGIELDSVGLALDGDRTGALRGARPTPVIARVDGQQTILDLRTVDPKEDAELHRVVASLI